MPDRDRPPTGRSPLKDAVDAMVDGCWVCSSVRDSEGVIEDFLVEYMNDSACRVSGTSMGEQLGRRLSNLLPEPEGFHLLQRYLDGVESGEPLSTLHHVPGDTRIPGLKRSR